METMIFKKGDILACVKTEQEIRQMIADGSEIAKNLFGTPDGPHGESKCLIGIENRKFVFDADSPFPLYGKDENDVEEFHVAKLGCSEFPQSIIVLPIDWLAPAPNPELK